MTNRYNIAKMFCVVLVIEIAAFSRTIYDCFCASDVFTKTQKKRNSDIVNGTCVTSSIRQYRNNLISPGKDLLNVIYPICFLAAVQFSLSKNKIVPKKIKNRRHKPSPTCCAPRAIMMFLVRSLRTA